MGVVNGQIVCHTGVIQFPMRKGWKRVHRFVVLPDYQGIGIGTAFIKQVAALYDAKGCVFNLTTTTPSLVHALCKSPNWVLKRYGRDKADIKGYERYKGCETKHISKSSSQKRITYSFYYKAL